MATIYLILCLMFGFPAMEVNHLKQTKTLTPLSKTELFEVLKDGHVKIFDKEPSTKRLASGWAQVALENGQGKKIYNNNLGNIGSSDRTPHFYISGHRFKANASPEEGARVYWSTIKEMCPSALAYFDHGDPKGAAFQLRRCGYYRADKNFYARLMSQLYYQACKEIICYNR